MMKYVLIKSYLMLLLALLLVQCQQERDAYFETPTWRGVSIYETLLNEGNFSKYLKLADMTQYSVSLKGNGLWTVFAPNDAAVDAWLAEKAYPSVDAVSEADANKIVAYSMLFNKYEFNQLSDVLYGGWDTIQSIKKRTPYYETIYREYYDYRGDSIWIISPTVSGNLNNTNDKNYKYLPFYLDRYFGSRLIPLTATDYNTFYSSPYTGRNIQRASVVKADMIARNGVIHEIDKVNEPLPTLEDLLNDDHYSLFKSLINLNDPTGQPYFIQYLTDSRGEITQYFKKLYPSKNIDMVYVKFYNLAVPMNCERYYSSYGASNKDPEMNGWTIFAPNNSAVQKFFNEVVNGYDYETLEELPRDILYYFISAQMNDVMVWPGEYSSSMNVQGDYLNGEGSKGQGLDLSIYTDIKPASNGFFYGSNDYIRNHFFETVYTEILLQPSKYTMFYNALQTMSLRGDLIKCRLNAYETEDFTVLLLTDDLLKADGFSWDWTGSAYQFGHSDQTVNAVQRMQRLVRSHVFKRIKTADIDTRILSFTGDPTGLYDGYAYAMNDYGDMVRYRNGRIQMLGNYETGQDVTATHVKTFLNGQVFAIDRLLQYSKSENSAEEVKQRRITDIANAAIRNPNVSQYAAYMKYILQDATDTWSLPEGQLTILMPNNTALTQARAQGFIQTVQAIDDAAKNGNMNPLDQAKDFFRYHVIVGAQYVNDGYEDMLLPTGKVQKFVPVTTALKLVFDNTYLRLDKSAGNLRVSTDRSAYEAQAFVTPGLDNSNLFSSRAVLHEINGFMVFKPEN